MNIQISQHQKLGFILLVVFLLGFSAGLGFSYYWVKEIPGVTAEDFRLDDQEATILAIKKVRPAVVSIIIYDWEEQNIINLSTNGKSKERVRKGSGTGFIISPDGLIITNKHMINTAEDETAEYRIILNSGKQYYAQLIGRDPIRDLAIIKIFDKDLPFVELGDSDQLQIGTTVIAIGNSLGRYQNSVTKGIVSGLGRRLEASDRVGNIEVLDNVIQTDAEINHGNSGGPLIDLKGQVVGINTAMDMAGTAIGFAIPVSDARPVINSVRTTGRIIRTRLGVRFVMLTPEMAEDFDLPRTSGAWLVKGVNGEAAVLPDAPAAKVGLALGDIIFEINAIKIEGLNTLFSVVQKYQPGDKIGLKIQRGNKVIIRVVELDEF